MFDGKLDSQSRLCRGLVLVNFDTIAFKGGEKVVDLFRGVHLGRKRIVDFVIKQIAALFADDNERFYRFVFFFQKNLRHKSSRSQQQFEGLRAGRTTGKRRLETQKKSI